MKNKSMNANQINSDSLEENKNNANLLMKNDNNNYHNQNNIEPNPNLLEQKNKSQSINNFKDEKKKEEKFEDNDNIYSE